MQLPQAVTFDFWNTLCFEPTHDFLRRRRLDAVVAVGRDAGIDLKEGPLLDALLLDLSAAAWLAYVEVWERNDRQFSGNEAAAVIIDGLEAAGIAVAPVRNEMIDAFATGARGAPLEIVADLEIALVAIKDAGIRIGIVCDVGVTPSPELRDHLQSHDLLKYFNHWSFSDEVGVYKPDARIFQHALDGLGVPAHAALHIGDRRRTDIAGAELMGMRTARITAIFDDQDSAQGPPGDIVVASYRELVIALGLS